MELKKPINTALKVCLGSKDNESCLIITDAGKKDIGKKFYEQALMISEKTEMIEIPIMERNGQEPSVRLNKIYDVALFVTTKSLTHTDFRKQLSRQGTRIASMPGITEDIIKRAIDVDYEKIDNLNKKIKEILEKTSVVEIKTKKGTDLKLRLKKGRDIKMDSGLFINKGDCGNLPGGEVFLAPEEGTTNGILIVDKSMAGVGKLTEPLKITIKNGFLETVEGKDSVKFLSNFKGLDKNAFLVAELGIGTNYKAKVTGVVLEDEKVKGTAHIAFGNNSGFGGNNNVPIHLDGVFSYPEIKCDGTVLDLM
jgi:leucyl aminopeptidase (aminopeptidase T)